MGVVSVSGCFVFSADTTNELDVDWGEWRALLKCVESK